MYRRSGRRILVVGAGPVGGYVAASLARGGCRVTLVEEHRDPGLPCHCTGIVTRDLLDLVEIPRSLVLNTIHRVRVTSADGTTAEIPSTDIVLDRIGFERHLVEEAVRAGADLRTGHRFVGFAPGGARISTPLGERYLPADIVIGADGPLSAVSRCAGLRARRDGFIGMQVRLEGSFAADLYEVHLVVPGFFGWVVPESEVVARVGVASRTAPRSRLTAILDRIAGPGRVLERQHGLIPLYDPRREVAARVAGVEVRLVGDAAAMVKATTGGGLVPGLAGADALCASLLRGTSYRRELMPLRRRLGAHLRVRRTLDTFTDETYGRLVGLCAGRRVSEVLAKGSRDRPVRLLAALMTADPRLALFGAGSLLGLGPRPVPVPRAEGDLAETAP